MLKVIFVTVFFAGAGLLHAEKPFIINKQGKKITADKITSDSKGTLTYTAKGFSQRMKPGQYKFARIPRPKSITSALSKIRSKQYDAAVKALDKCYQQYRYLGHDVDCIFYAAYCLEKLGKKSEAIAKINKLTEKPKDTSKMKKYMETKKLLADLYIAESKFKDAEEVLKELSGAQSPAIAAFANNKRGDILLKKGERKDALLMYLRTVLLFNKTNKKERPEALFQTIKILKDDRNNKYLEFEKILKTDYPSAKAP